MDVIRADSFDRRHGPDVIKTRRLPVRPMSVEEAVMQMDLMSNEFFVFRNAATDVLSVVYRRKDGDYGLLFEIKDFMRSLERSLAQIAANANPRLILECLMLDMPIKPL